MCDQLNVNRHTDDLEDEDDPKQVIVYLCKELQACGHMTASAGAIAMKQEGKIFITPTGVLKERVKPEDIFVVKDDRIVDYPPPNKKLRRSSNSSLFELIFKKTDADCAIHTHCLSANLVTQLCLEKEFRICNQEVIKGIRNSKTGCNYKNSDELILPILENVPEEPDLEPQLSQAIEGYPETCAVLVRNHGIYVWGKTWQKTKIMYEAYCYLFDVYIKMKVIGAK